MRERGGGEGQALAYHWQYFVVLPALTPTLSRKREREHTTS
ncbi:protein of unknown function [Cupriavidus neocaledonicus]|uniref:Uncharacterized protein n=1 Tax=Cupriavidus neocaledonicus TaxID=1040979 RepID=A0A375H7Q2_9BURK|nr:hypothetical protein CBM2605_A80141 [Cupriavidus neocaledonicus]SPD46230.1 protein of unknown function [Cupriavidus neocaledonicus]